jgi:hypothetical protein
MNRLSKEQRTKIIAALVEGNSLRAVARMCDVAFNTVLKLVPDIGRACAEYQDRVLRNLPCKRIQCDEIWSFVYAKQKNVPADLQGQFGYGDVWTWVDHVWSVTEIAGLLESRIKRSHYRRPNPLGELLRFVYNQGLSLKSWPRLSGSKRKQEHESGNS